MSQKKNFDITVNFDKSNFTTTSYVQFPYHRLSCCLCLYTAVNHLSNSKKPVRAHYRIFNADNHNDLCQLLPSSLFIANAIVVINRTREDVLLLFVRQSRCRLGHVSRCIGHWEAMPPRTTNSKQPVNYFTQTELSVKQIAI